MDVENLVEEDRRLRAQVADFKSDHAQKARTTLSVPIRALDVGPAHGVGRSSPASDVMTMPWKELVDRNQSWKGLK